MNGLMMNYQLTMDRILEHANRLFAPKRIITLTAPKSARYFLRAGACCGWFGHAARPDEGI